MDEKFRFGLGFLANTLCAAAVGLGLHLLRGEEEMRVLRWLKEELKSVRECESGERRRRALRVEDSIRGAQLSFVGNFAALFVYMQSAVDWVWYDPIGYWPA